jgi:hypothetical protein
LVEFSVFERKTAAVWPSPADSSAAVLCLRRLVSKAQSTPATMPTVLNNKTFFFIHFPTKFKLSVIFLLSQHALWSAERKQMKDQSNWLTSRRTFRVIFVATEFGHSKHWHLGCGLFLLNLLITPGGKNERVVTIPACTGVVHLSCRVNR